MEFSPFIDVIGWANTDYGHNIKIDICGFTKKVNSSFNVTILTNLLIDEVNIENYDALAIPGGFEEYDFYKEAFDEKFLNLIREFDKNNKIIASVCVGSLPIGKSGVLKNRKATSYHLNNGQRQKQLADFGVNVINESIVVDKNIISSYCPETAPHVAFKLLEILTSTQEMQKIKSAMGF